MVISAGPAAHLPRPPVPAAHARWAGRRCVISFEGELDLATAPLLDRVITSAIDSGAAELWLDLGPATFVDVAGLRCLLRADEACGARGRRLTVICPEGHPLRRLLRLARTEGRLQLRTSRHAARIAA
jgi:anti-anti-sigma factor